MVFAGFFMVFLAVYALWMLRKNREFSVSPFWGSVFFIGIFMPYLANSFGWIMTEVGRSPWTVYGLLKFEESISTNVGNGALWLSLIGFVLVYGILMVADVYLLVKYAKAGPGGTEAKSVPAGEPSFAGSGD